MSVSILGAISALVVIGAACRRRRRCQQLRLRRRRRRRRRRRLDSFPEACPASSGRLDI